MSALVGHQLGRCLVRYHKRTNPSASLQQFQQVRNLRQFKEKSLRSMYWRGRSFDRVQYEELDRRSRLLEWNYRSEVFAFSRRLHENLSEDTLRQVFTHPSYGQQFAENQAKLNLPHIQMKLNSQFVQKGQELITTYVKPYLRCLLSRVPEDGIEQVTQYLQTDSILADIANWIGCKEIILCSEYPPSEETMANTVRALIGGINHEEPTKTCRFIVDFIISYLDDKDLLNDVWHIPNPQETLNLILANSQLPAYEPRIMFQTGRGTLEACHVVGLYTNQKFLGSSAGETLDIAEHCAALNALQKLFDLTEDRQPFIYGEKSESLKLDNYKERHAYVKTWSFKLDELQN